MCIIYFAYDVHPEYPLVLIANRDEFYDRPTAAAHWWGDHPTVYAGRDLVKGGTWLGISKAGRVAAVTNYREPSAPESERSRGELVADFLRGDEASEDYLAAVAERQSEYSGFNLLVGEFNRDRREMFYLANRGEKPLRLEPGVYALSNHLLDTAWPKVTGGRGRFETVLAQRPLEKERLFEILADESLAEDNALPDTGIGYEREKALSAIFIRTPIYGTRSSTLVIFDNDFVGSLDERVFV